MTEQSPIAPGEDSMERMMDGMNGGMESLAVVLTDATLADCIEQLGDHSEDPTSDELRDVLPGIVERHGLAATRIMLAATPKKCARLRHLTCF